MKRFVYALLLVLGMCIVAASCEKDDGTASIIGKWGAEKYEYIKDGKVKSTRSYNYRESDVCFTFTDQKQATVDLYYVGKDGTRECRSTVSTYILMGNSLMIGQTPYVITKRTSKVLVLGCYEAEEDEEESWYFLRRIE